MHYDLIIIGGGPIGIVCGIEAQKAKLKYLILEKGVLVNSLYHFPTNMTFFSTSILLEIGEVPFISHSDKPTRTESLEYYRRIVAAWKLSIHLFEPVRQVIQFEHSFGVQTDKAMYTANKVIISTGFYDLEDRLNIRGEELPKVQHYYRDPHPYFMQNLAVIGGGNSACDAALECWQKGAQVTMIVRDSSLKDTIKYWIKPNIENRIKDGVIKAYFESTVKEIKPNSLIIQTNNEVVEIENDFVLALTGYQPDYQFLEDAGVQFQSDEFKTPIYKEDTLETNVPGLYLAGVIIGGLKTNKWFIENTRDHGTRIHKRYYQEIEVMKDIELVIFDCDGVLVDTEKLANKVFIEEVSKYGFKLTEAEAWEYFPGSRFAHCVAIVEDMNGRKLPAEFTDIYKKRSAEVFAMEVQPIPGVEQVLSKLKLPKVVASNGPKHTIKANLITSGLIRYFDEEHLFSAYEIQKWKPDPDLHLAVSKHFGINPANCLVIEDSVPGAQAAISAGMHVLGFLHDGRNQKLFSIDIPRFDHMEELFKYHFMG
jgi:thioredoxin reductase (NADPH)